MRVVLKRTVVGYSDLRFNNLSERLYQGQLRSFSGSVGSRVLENETASFTMMLSAGD